jgi:hypothetical protein
MSWTGLDERDAKSETANDLSNVMAPGRRDEGQMILTRPRFVNRVGTLCRNLIAQACRSEIKNVSLLIEFLN